MKHFTNKIVRLVKPYNFQLIENVQEANEYDVVISPTLCYICAADVRYYTGNRRPEALKKKLPMALLHEGIGIVTCNANEFEKGDRVIIVPNIPGFIRYRKDEEECCISCADETIGENYCENAIFISSGYDGLMQQYIAHPKECVYKIPDEVPDEIAALSELVTVCYEAAKRVKIKENEQIVIFGDGPVGYLLYSVISFIFKVSAKNLTIIGTDEAKLEAFEYAQKINIRNEETENDINKLRPNYVFECVGGNNMADAINTSINIIKRGGTIVSMGVSEQNVAINIRDVLEKGLTIKGSSRSSRFVYPIILEYMKDKKFQNLLMKIICTRSFSIRSISDIKDAFDFAVSKDYWGKIKLNIKGELYE